VTQLSEGNQRTTSTSKESAAIAEELSSQTTDLLPMLQLFTLSGRRADPGTTSRPTPPALPKAAPAPQAPAVTQPPSPSAETKWSCGTTPSQPVIKLDDDDFSKYWLKAVRNPQALSVLSTGLFIRIRFQSTPVLCFTEQSRGVDQ
jgi:methyl-accepting chemotaxis protein